MKGGGALSPAPADDRALWPSGWWKARVRDDAVDHDPVVSGRMHAEAGDPVHPGDLCQPDLAALRARLAHGHVTPP